MNERTCFMCGKKLKSRYEREVGMCMECMEEEISGEHNDIYNEQV